VARLERTDDSVQVRGIRGATIVDATNILKKHPDNDTRNMTLVIGSNDCDTNTKPENILDQFSGLINETHRVASDEVNVSSILPRLTGQDYQDKADLVNQGLKELCLVKSCNFVDNNQNFRHMNGEVDESVFTTDNIHLTSAGCMRLIKNLRLQDKIRMRRSYAQVASAPPSQESKKKLGSKLVPMTASSRPVSNNTRPTFCWYCGETGHVKDSCRHGHRVTCYRCGKQGHKRKLCRARI